MHHRQKLRKKQLDQVKEITNKSVPYEKRNYFVEFNIESTMNFLSPQGQKDLYGDSSEIKKVLKMIQKNEHILK